MQNQIIKKQNMESLFRETFHLVVEQFKNNVYFCGRKMYIKLNNIIISVDFIGTNVAYNNVMLTAASTYGVIDQNITPLSMIFKESKMESGLDKIVSLRVVAGGGGKGEYTVIWSGDLTDGDKINLNEFIINYIELLVGI